MRHTLSILLLLLGINPIIAQTSLTTYSTTICSGGNAIVTATNLDQTVTFIWTSFNGQPSQTGNFLNVASATQSDTWTCTTNNTNSQPIDSDIFTVTVNALPVVSAGANQTLCAGTSVTLSGSGAVSYTWNNNVQNGVTFTPTSTQTYTVTGTDANGCTNTDQAIVTVNPTPVIPTQNISACSGTIFTSNPQNNIPTTIIPNGTTYTWTQPIVTGNITGGSAQNNQATISQTLINPTNLTQTATYTVTPTSGSCVGATFTAIVTVNPTPVIPTQNISACSGTIFTSNPQNNIPTTIIPNGTTYTWTQPIVTGNITGGSAQNNQATISQTLINPTNIQRTATYTVTATSGAAGNCVSATFQLVISVNPIPIIPNQTQTICSGNPFTIAPTNGAGNTVPSGTTYSWTNPAVPGGITGGSGQNNQANISQSLTNPTNSTQTATYIITPVTSAPYCVGPPFTLTVTVNPVPSITIQTQTICSGNPFTIAPTNGAGNTVPSGTTYSWTNPTVTGGITGGSAQNNQANISQTLTNPTNSTQTATYTVTPMSGNCAGATFLVNILVKPLPMLTLSASQTICGGTPTTLTNFSNSLVGGTISWTLSNPLSVPGTVTGYQTSGNGQIPVSTINNGGTSPYTLSYQVTPTANGCSGSAGTYSITVNPLPDSTITPNGATTFCSGGSVTLSAMPNYSSYTWNKDGIVIPGAASATYFATQSGVYSVSITNQYSCNSMESITVNNLTIPVAAVSNASPANFFCQGNNTTLNASANCQGCNLSYQWLVNGTNTPGTNPSLIVTATGNYSVVIGNSLNGIVCLDTSNNIFITSLAIVPPSFTGLPDSICVNETFVLPQLSNNNIAGTYIAGTWNPLIISNQSSSYTFTPLLGQCASTYSWNVQLVSLPQPSLGNDLVICAGDSTILISQGFNSYLWSNGSSDSSITVAPSATTQYILSVTNSLGCVGADSIDVAVNPVPPLPFISGSESLCLNSLNQVYSTTPTVNWLIWNIDGANIYSGQYTNEVHLDLTSSDTLWINLTEHILNTGCYSTNTLMVLVDTNASAPPYVNVLPLGNQNDFLCAPQAIGIFRWGKIDKNTNDIYFYPSVYTYHNFTVLDTVNYFYFVDHGELGCFTRSYYAYPQSITSTEELSASTYWISPNPVINELSINSAKTELVWVFIENLDGKLVFKEEVWTNNPINCGSFITGMYFVRIEKAAELNFVKFLKF